MPEWSLDLSTYRSKILDERIVLGHRSRSAREILWVIEPQRIDTTESDTSIRAILRGSQDATLKDVQLQSIIP